MGAQAVAYVRRKLAGITGATHEFELYFQPERLWPRPCYCEWTHLQDRLLGRPKRDGIPCACVGPVPFNVPGYPDEEFRMRRFAEERNL